MNVVVKRRLAAEAGDDPDSILGVTRRIDDIDSSDAGYVTQCTDGIWNGSVYGTDSIDAADYSCRYPLT